MKTLIIQLDDEVAAQIERVAPGRSRRRSEFIRDAIRKALWEIEERATCEAYQNHPDSAEAYLNPAVWETTQKTRRRRSGK